MPTLEVRNVRVTIRRENPLEVLAVAEIWKDEKCFKVLRAVQAVQGFHMHDNAATTAAATTAAMRALATLIDKFTAETEKAA